ncbi:hypothetical protein [uncultured Draconibacterium sp.]|uniref:hypothetical protein n=1 Tax=uncultured Draconibacterium sp. TaxID=1573823 RepID=UPI00321748EE
MNSINQQLSSPFMINNCEVKNRCIIRSGEGTAAINTAHVFTKETIDGYIRQAENGIGMIIAGAQVAGSAILNKKSEVWAKSGLNRLNTVSRLKRMVSRVSRCGTKIFAGLYPGVNNSLPLIALERRKENKTIIGKHFLDTELVRMENDSDQKLIDHFISSAKMAQILGYHGVQINVAGNRNKETGFVNDYTLMNDSVDDILIQFRIALKVIGPIKEMCGKDFPVTLNVNLSHYLINYFESQLSEEQFYEPELSYNEFLEDFRRLEKAGYDAFSLTSSQSGTTNWYFDEVYHKPFFNLTRSIKKWIKVPVIIGGDKKNAEVAAYSIGKGDADAIVMEDSLNMQNVPGGKGLINNNDYFMPSYFWIA